MFGRRSRGGERTAEQLWQEQVVPDRPTIVTEKDSRSERFSAFILQSLKSLQEARNPGARQLHLLRPATILAGLFRYDTTSVDIPRNPVKYWYDEPTVGWLLPGVVQPRPTRQELGPLLLAGDGRCSRLNVFDSLVQNDHGYFLPEIHLTTVEQLTQHEQERTRHAVQALLSTIVQNPS